MKVLVLGFGNASGRYNPPSTHCENYLSGTMGDHEIITFGYNDGVDIVISPDDEFERVLERLPAGWVPDICILWMIEWNLLPKGIERAPFPTAACIFDWDYDLPHSRTCIESVDLTIVTGDHDREAVMSIGANNAEAFYFAGAMKEYFNPDPKKIREREIDVLYTTWIDESVQPGRSDWISKLCSLSDRYVVHIDKHLRYREYLALLNNSKLVLSYNRHGSMAVRTTDAGTQGTVVLDTSCGTEKYFKPHEDYIPVTEEDLAMQIERYLGDEKMLQEMSDRFYRKVAHNFEARRRFQELIDLAVEKLAGKKTERKIRSLSDSEWHIRRGELYFYAHFAGEPGVFFLNTGGNLLEFSIEEFRKAVAIEPSPRAMTDLAVAMTAYGLLFEKNRFIGEKGKDAADILERVISGHPSYLMAYFNLAILHLRTGNLDGALKVFRTAAELPGKGDGHIDPWCLHNRDFDVFNQLVRRNLNNSLIAIAGGDESAGQNVRDVFRSAIFYMIFLIEENKGRAYASLEAIKSACELSPDSGLLMKKAARIMTLLGFRDEGVEMYRKAVQLCPFNTGLRTELIQLLYLDHKDMEVMSEMKKALKIMRTVATVREDSNDLKVRVENFLRFSDRPVYGHDSSREVLLNSWIETLFDYVRKEPEDLNLVFRIVQIWNEIGRSDKIITIMEDYIGRYREQIEKNEIISQCFSDICNFLREKIGTDNHEYTRKHRGIMELLADTGERLVVSGHAGRGAV